MVFKFFKRSKKENEKQEWQPRNINDYPPEELVQKLKRWQKDPASEPEIEEWYQKEGHKLGQGKPFAERKPEKWEADFDKYYPMYEKARELEKNGNMEDALNVYLSILDNYAPVGINYYERPAILLEKQGRYEEALNVCDMALNNKTFTPPTHKAVQENFTKRKNRLLRKISRQK